MRIVHYPWRVAMFPETPRQDLPLPPQERISPTIGAFAVGDDGSIMVSDWLSPQNRERISFEIHHRELEDVSRAH